MNHPDIHIEIAVGRDRKTVQWKNTQMTWQAFTEKLSVTHRTHETYAEYLAAKPDRQASIKDVGGFVGGYLSGGRRKSGRCLHRSIITLDADYAKPDLWTRYCLLYDAAACVYSTHKHSPEKPRLRLVILLDRPVIPDEYTAISRRIAGMLGIEQFDPTGYQVERLMYWPSTSKDGVFYFDVQDGPPLCADDLLATYTDWRDSSGWPTSDKEQDVVKRDIKKQGDPLEKPGIVGAFCRTYDIHQAIEKYLGDVYEPTAEDSRYTYLKGTTAGGLVVYDDKFAYSHHGTDPVIGKLCNAFDLVRLHLFGLQDEDSTEKLVTKMPSFTAMSDFAAKDAAVKKQILRERVEQASIDFAEDEDSELAYEKDTPGEDSSATRLPSDQPAEGDDDEWKEKLEVNGKTKEAANTINNIVLILLNHKTLKDNIYYDEFECRGAFRQSVPWRAVTHQSRYITDRDLSNIKHRIETYYGIRGGGTSIETALDVVFERTRVHPVRDYLNAQQWDGVPRVDTLFIDYMGASDSPYIRAVARKTLAAAVARIFEPGCKFDYIPTLVGEQGLRKSMLIEKLGGPWFTDTFNFHMIKDKRAYEAIQGAWIVEIGELAGMAKAEIEGVKSFVSSRRDKFRKAFGKILEDQHRCCIFIGSTNRVDFLRDQTGNRRFWPVSVHAEARRKNVSVDLTAAEIGQIWAEAVQIYRSGEPLYLTDSLESEARDVQDMHTEQHPWFAVIENYLDTKVPDNWEKMTSMERRSWLQDDEEMKLGGREQITKVCAMELWEVALVQRGPIDEKGAAVLRNIMSKIGGWKEAFEQLRFGIYGRQRRGFIRASKSGAKSVSEGGAKVSQLETPEIDLLS